MKSLIFATFVALNFAGCAFLGQNSAQTCADMSAKQMQVVNFVRHSANAYTYKFDNNGKICTANSGKYDGNPGDVALVSIASGRVVKTQIISRKIQPGTPQTYTPVKVIKKQLHKNENIAAPVEEQISF